MTLVSCLTATIFLIGWITLATAQIWGNGCVKFIHQARAGAAADAMAVNITNIDTSASAVISPDNYHKFNITQWEGLTMASPTSNIEWVLGLTHDQLFPISNGSICTCTLGQQRSGSCSGGGCCKSTIHAYARHADVGSYLHMKSRTKITNQICTCEQEFELTASTITTTEACFWAGNEVQTLERGVVKISQLEIGEHVQSIGADGTIYFSEVLLHMDSVNGFTTFIRVTTKSGKRLMLTPNHLIHIKGSSPKFASSLQIGEEVWVIESSTVVPDIIISTEQVFDKGANSPLTESGSIVVNDILASCYAAHNNHDAIHMFLAPLRIYLRAKKFAQYIGLISPLEEDDTEGKHPYIATLMATSKAWIPYQMHHKYHPEL